MAETLLTVKDLTIRFGGLTAVEKVSFTLPANRILAIIGPNGAGKTTVFNMISGIYAPTEGSIYFRERLINGLAPHVINTLGIARTFQNSRLFNSLSVLDNVILGGHARRRTGFAQALLRRDRIRAELADDIRASEELLAFFSEEMKANALRRAGDLPQGDKRKLEICRALISEPRIVLLDEPSAGMDPNETRELMEDIRKVKDRNPENGIILIEHDMSVVKGVADHILVLSYGKMIAAGSFAEIAANKQVQEAYLGKRKAYT
jgi:branched-chain amino acid transport system ATP-binding protein